jgi:hypothetical protein
MKIRFLRRLLLRIEEREAEKLAQRILNSDPEVLHLLHERLEATSLSAVVVATVGERSNVRSPDISSLPDLTAEEQEQRRVAATERLASLAVMQLERAEESDRDWRRFAHDFSDGLAKATPEEAALFVCEVIASGPKGTLSRVLEDLHQVSVDAYELGALDRLKGSGW